MTTDALVADLVPDAPFTESRRHEEVSDLRARLARDGYLFVRGLVERERLLGVRRDILRLCRAHGWLAEGSDDLDGIYSGRAFPDYGSEYMPLYHELIALPSFNACSTCPELMAFLRRLLDGEVLAHARNIARIVFPRHDAFVTQPHQDWFYIGGTPETYTAWIPLGDCPRDLGALAVLSGSHRLGALDHVPTIGPGQRGVRVEGLDLRWVGSDFRCGDAVIFHSCTVHAALRNRSADRLRLSLDYRYQRADLPIDPASMRPHGG